MAGKDNDDMVLRWIQERITCCIPEEDSNPKLHRLVMKYQYHKCNNYCRRRKQVKGTFITLCRFRFPGPTCESATLFSVNECMKLSHRKIYSLPRSPNEQLQSSPAHVVESEHGLAVYWRILTSHCLLLSLVT